jgi:curved DNA-binding protein CbpA
LAELPDYYRVLGVSRLASAENIKAGFREMARKRHPDFGGTTDEFVALQAAYEVLNDPDQRAEYDALLVKQAKAQTSTFREASLFSVYRPAVEDPLPDPEPAAPSGPRPTRQELDMLMRKGELHQADAMARRWLTQNIDPGYAHFVLGLIKLKENQPDEATAQFSMALQHEPRNEEYNRRFEAASKLSAPEMQASRPGCAGAALLVVALGWFTMWQAFQLLELWSSLSTSSVGTPR